DLEEGIAIAIPKTVSERKYVVRVWLTRFKTGSGLKWFHSVPNGADQTLTILLLIKFDHVAQEACGK
ncbi:MAG: hypothetical protein DMG72_19050, partial [Acidobacteria bacterium]